MNIYIVKKVAANIKNHMVSFILITLELTIAIGFLFYVINLIFSLQYKAGNIQAKKEIADYMIISTNNTSDVLDFNDEQILMLKKSFDNNILFSQVCYYRHYFNYFNAPEDIIYIILCDNIFLNRIVNISDTLNNNTCIIGNNALSLISKYQPIKKDNIYIDKSFVKYFNKSFNISYNNINSVNKFSLGASSVGSFYDVNPSNCIFIPVDAISLNDIQSSNEQLYVFFENNNHSLYEQISLCSNITSLLSAHNGLTYQFENQISRLYYEYTIINEEIELYLFISFLCILIILFAIGGIKVINIYQCSKKIAISMAIGATNNMLILEITGDNIIIHVLAFILGVACGTIICHVSWNYLTEIHIYMQSYLIVLLVLFISYLLSYILIRNEFLKIKPIKILK